MDGALNIQYAGAGGYWGYTIDLDGTVVDDFQLINRYREMQIVAEVDEAIDQIINELVIQDAGRMPVTLDLDYIDESLLDEMTKIRLQSEFDSLLKQLKFHKDAYSLVRQWYIDGRIYYHLIVDEERPENGIQELQLRFAVIPPILSPCVTAMTYPLFRVIPQCQKMEAQRTEGSVHPR
jgi:hypothetical protein